VDVFTLKFLLCFGEGGRVELALRSIISESI